LFLARRTLAGTAIVDSAMPDKSGQYRLRGYTTQPDFFIVYFQTRHYINLIIHPGDDFKVLTSRKDFEYNYLVEGSKDSRLIQKLVTMQAKTLQKITAISNEYENSIKKPGFNKVKARVDSMYKEIVEEHRAFSKELIRENPKSLASLMALYQQLGRDIPVFDYKTDFVYYERVDSNLAALFPNSEAVKDLDRKVHEIRDIIQTETGAIAPAISLPGLDGRVHKLSSLRGKYVLLVFWASWSSQSCNEVKKLVPVYHSYNGKGLEIYMISLDRSRDSWQKELDVLQPPGIQVSDLKYWDSPVVNDYRINQLPALFLIDRDGKILKKDFSADDLTSILSALLPDS
jgi:thiol-disulfide isomerase/thioredoxin